MFKRKVSLVIKLKEAVEKYAFFSRKLLWEKKIFLKVYFKLFREIDRRYTLTSSSSAAKAVDLPACTELSSQTSYDCTQFG